MQPSIGCVSRPSEAKKRSKWPLVPLHYELVAMLWYYREGQCMTSRRCQQIADKALVKMFRQMRRQFPNLNEELGTDFNMLERECLRNQIAKVDSDESL